MQSQATKPRGEPSVGLLGSLIARACVGVAVIVGAAVRKLFTAVDHISVHPGEVAATGARRTLTTSHRVGAHVIAHTATHSVNGLIALAVVVGAVMVIALLRRAFLRYRARTRASTRLLRASARPPIDDGPIIRRG